MRAHIIESGIVTNTIEVESLDFMPNLISGETGGIGWSWDGETLTPPELEPPTKEYQKLTGIKILNVMCSATSQDQSGLTAVAMGTTLARMNGQTFPATRFEFENGNKLVITDDNFDLIYSTWTPFRQSFFVI
jgi:hypothetical protein